MNSEFQPLSYSGTFFNHEIFFKKSTDGLLVSSGSTEGCVLNRSWVKGQGRRGVEKAYLPEDASQHAPHGLAFGPQQPVDILQVLQRLAELRQIKQQHRGR